MDILSTGPVMAAVARDIWAADSARMTERESAMQALSTVAVAG
jgi:hypothetical protein